MTGKTVSFILALALMLCGCQKTPEKAVVASKADGAFEAALARTEPPAAATEPQTTAAPAVYRSSFSNAAGDMTVDLAVTEPAVSGPVPVIQARPMELTGRQAESIAAALFGDGPIYEYTDRMTRAEIEQAILEDRQFISDWDGMLDYYGGDAQTAQRVKEDFEGRIAALEEAYRTAPEESEPVPCAWEFHSEDYYMSPDMAASFQDEGHRVIQATANLDGLPWVFSVCNREGEDYRVHNAAAYPDERVVFQEDVAAGPGMDEEAMRVWALETAASMDLGDWAVTSDPIGEVTGMGGGDPEDWYMVALTRTYGDIQAAPFFDAPAADEQYASVYGAENMQFTFKNGHFYSFWYSAATRTVDTASPDAPLLPFADVLDRAKEQMKMLTMDRLLYAGDSARVAADTVELGLVCVPMKDNATDFYLVPAWIFCGTATSYDAGGMPSLVQWMDNEGNVVDEQPAQSAVLLAAINAVDGSVINTGFGG